MAAAGAAARLGMQNGLDESSLVAELQQSLIALNRLCKQCEASSNTVSVLVDRQKSGSGAHGSDDVIKNAIDQLERQVAKADEVVNNLQETDDKFHATMQKALASKSYSFKAKKLKGDYERKLQVKQAVTKGQEVVKRARLTLLELKKRRMSQASKQQQQTPVALSEEGKENQRGGGLQQGTLPPSVPSSSSSQLQGQGSGDIDLNDSMYQRVENQQQYALREYSEDQTDELETNELRIIARNAALVEEMAVEVGSLLEVQQDDVNQLEDNTEDSVARTMEGVHELSRARRRQASNGAAKASLGTATVGGLVGIFGGPVGIVIGAAAGGMMGLAAGKGVAAVKRRSINAETRRIKALLAMRKKKSGEFTLQVYAFENQQWSFLKRRWMESDRVWTDEFGDPLTGAHPELEMSAPEARMQILADAHANGPLSDEEAHELAELCRHEVEQDIVWSWASGKWDVVMGRPGCDLAGWEYGSSMSTDKWVEKPKRNCVIRRKLWVRYLLGKPELTVAQKAAADRLLRLGEVQMEGIGTGDDASAGGDRPRGSAAAAAMDPGKEKDKLWDGIYSSTLTTNAVMTESLTRVNQQGEQISKSERNATIVGDAALYSERIDRAANFSGAVRNMMTWKSGKLSSADSFARSLDKKRQEQQQADLDQRKEGPRDEAGDIVDSTASVLEENLRIAKSLASELEVQNVQLDRAAAAVERGNDGMVKITKKIR
ncbi:t-SNARE coiled-coil homology domain-containing protein [Durusdinium trenchii]|uniref:t-SNARE coiled-coil homology domain-containing protein n=1 Tax=Durusdinium trenchii TaxID=1381693 RepID=A0ABP0L3E5_9DINO